MKKINPKIKTLINTIERSRSISEYKVVDPKTGEVRVKKTKDWPPISKLIKVKKDRN